MQNYYNLVQLLIIRCNIRKKFKQFVYFSVKFLFNNKLQAIRKKGNQEVKLCSIVPTSVYLPVLKFLFVRD